MVAARPEHLDERQEDARCEPGQVGGQPLQRVSLPDPAGTVEMPPRRDRGHRSQPHQHPARAQPSAAYEQEHEHGQHGVEGDLGCEAPHLREAGGERPVLVDVQQQQR
jgi:hypothetical protein